MYQGWKLPTPVPEMTPKVVDMSCDWPLHGVDVVGLQILLASLPES